jgi:phospho-N-acetylmuramoyl-pentapeptide-transferase
MEHSIFLYKILIPTLFTFIIGLVITPFFTNIFYKYRMWKRSARINEENTGVLGGVTDEFKKIYNKNETHTPRVGGIIIWISVSVTLITASLLFYFSNAIWTRNLNIITRSQTLIPFVSFLLGAFLGLIDDFLQIFGNKKNLMIGIPRWLRISFVLFLGAVEGIWFYNKLGFNSIPIPFTDFSIYLGAGSILFFMFVVLALFSSSVIDGLDGLAAGVLSIIFGTYGFIGLFQGQYNIAAFSFIVLGALLAFLWFNVPPARFYLGETGILSLTLSLSVIIFLTNTVVEFIIIGMPLVITAGSSFIQIISRRFFNKKILRIAPLHHHLESIGWSKERITMRYWIFAVFSSILGIILVILK